jgi:Tfp pilus assembly protein PilX
MVTLTEETVTAEDGNSIALAAAAAAAVEAELDLPTSSTTATHSEITHSDDSGSDTKV